MFLCPYNDLSIGVQTAVKAPLCLCRWEILQPRKFDSQAEIGGPKAVVRVNRREHLAPTVGPGKTWSHPQLCLSFLTWWGTRGWSTRIRKEQGPHLAANHGDHESPPMSKRRSQGWPVEVIPRAWNVGNLGLYFQLRYFSLMLSL